MKRLALATLSALLLIGALSTSPAASRPAPPARTGGDVVYVHDTLAWLRGNIVGMSFGPSQKTGYGKATITGIVKGCPECPWYHATMNITNHQPTGPMTRQARRGGPCWFWDSWPFGDGCAAWNDPTSWDWGPLWMAFNDDWHPWNPNTTSYVQRLLNCAQGTASAWDMRVVGKSIVAGMAEDGWMVKLNDVGGPEEWMVAGVGGCLTWMFH